MCRKLLCLAALLCIASVASAQTTVVDDFESYWGTPAMLTTMGGPWSQTNVPGTTVLIQLVTSGAPQGSQAGRGDWSYLGGWDDPANPTNYDALADHAGMNISIPAFDWVPGTSLHLSFNPDQVAGLNEYLIEYTGDSWAQTWIPGPGNYGVQWWMPAEICPGVLLETGQEFPNWGGAQAAGWIAAPEINPGVWTDLVITDIMGVPWSSVPTDLNGYKNLSGFDAMTGMHIDPWWVNTANPGGTPTKLDGSTVVYPSGPQAGGFMVDNIYFVPEPTTIALLGLGGLALIRRKR